jgi:hypothetical protein
MHKLLLGIEHLMTGVQLRYTYAGMYLGVEEDGYIHS